MRGGARIEATKLGQNNTRMDWPHAMLGLRGRKQITHDTFAFLEGEDRGNYALLQDERAHRSVEVQICRFLLEFRNELGAVRAFLQLAFDNRLHRHIAEHVLENVVQFL